MFFFSSKVGATDGEMSYFSLTSRLKPGSESYDDIKDLFVNHVQEGSTVFSDTCSAYKTVKRKHPDLVSHLRQVNHSKGEFSRAVNHFFFRV